MIGLAFLAGFITGVIFLIFISCIAGIGNDDEEEEE